MKRLMKELLSKEERRAQLSGSKEQLLLKLKKGKKVLSQRIINNKVLVTGTVSTGKEEKKPPTTGRRSYQANKRDEKTDVISISISKKEGNSLNMNGGCIDMVKNEHFQLKEKAKGKALLLFS